MTQPLPPGQGPVDPRTAFWPPPPPPGSGRPPGPPFPPGTPGGWMPPPFPMMPPTGLLRPRSQGKFLNIVLALFVLVLLLDLVGLNLVFFGAIAQADKPQALVSRVVLTDGDPQQIVAVIPVTGLITDQTYKQFDGALTEAERDSSVKAVIIQVNTPGGSATASDEMYHRLLVFKSKREGVKVTISMGAMATSGGYYVSCGGDTIYAEPGTMTANIGVLMPNINLSELMQKWGIQDTTIVGTGGTYKEAGSPLKPVDDQSRQYLQKLVDATLDQFKSVVITSRFKPGKQPPAASDIFNGAVMMAHDAQTFGLVDKIGYLDDAEAYAASAASLSSPRFVRFDPPATLLGRLTGSDSLSGLSGGQASSAIDINGATIDLRQLSLLLASRPIYLWTGN